jgi:leucine dehydrogenase
MNVRESREFDAHEQACFFTDEATGLRSIVAVHSTALGAAAGGTRFKAYHSEADAVMSENSVVRPLLDGRS